MRLVSLQIRGSAAINCIFGLIWICYGPKRDILDYWVIIIYCLLSYYILSRYKGYKVETMGMGRSHWNNGAIGTFIIYICTRVLIVRDNILW